MSSLPYKTLRDFVAAITILSIVHQASGERPLFDMASINVTVVEEEIAILPCTVLRRGQHKVAWSTSSSTVLTYGEERVIDDSRVSIERPQKGTWNLRIHDVKRTDEGTYLCNVNTIPVISKIVVLIVKVPAKIDLSRSSPDEVAAAEGEDVVLTCNATGVPAPNITWYRKQTKNAYGSHREKLPVWGTLLILPNVTRKCQDYYECRADNGYEPPDRYSIHMQVRFKPEVTLLSDSMGQQLRKDTVLGCRVSSNPPAQVNWYFKGRPVVTDARHRVTEYDLRGRFSVRVNLRISILKTEDFGLYTCMADNSEGKTTATMELYQHQPKVKPKPTGVRTGQEPTSADQPVNRRKPHKKPGTSYKYGPKQTHSIESVNAGRVLGGCPRVTGSLPLTSFAMMLWTLRHWL